MIVIGYLLISEKLNLVQRKSFVKDSFERLVVGFLIEDFRPHVAAIQGVTKSARSVSSWWSWHDRSLPRLNCKTKRPDPFAVHIGSTPARDWSWRGSFQGPKGGQFLAVNQGLYIENAPGRETALMILPQGVTQIGVMLEEGKQFRMDSFINRQSPYGKAPLSGSCCEIPSWPSTSTTC